MHLTVYELYVQYGKFGESASMRKLMTKWKRTGLITPIEMPISETNPHVCSKYCEHAFCTLVIQHRSETYVSKIFSTNFRRISKVIATGCEKNV